MKDDYSGEDQRMTTLSRDLPAPQNRGLFRRARRPGHAKGEPAQLRVVTASIEKTPQRMDQWDNLREMAPGKRSVLVHRDHGDAADPVTASFDHLRTHLLKSLRANGWNRVAIAAPTQGCGTTFSAVNLALSLSRIPGLRTLLMDLNQRRPGLSTALDMKGAGDMRGFLTGRNSLHEHMVRASAGLAVGLTQAPDPQAAHLLHTDECALAIGDMMDRLLPDVLLCDMPPILENDDLSAFLPQVDGVLLVADGTRTLPKHIAECERILSGQTRVIGVVLNQARLSGPVPIHA